MSEPTLIPPWDRDERDYKISALESQLAAAQTRVEEEIHTSIALRDFLAAAKRLIDELRWELGKSMLAGELPMQTRKEVEADNAELRAEVNRLRNVGGWCTLARPGRGDCEHFVGLPGISIPDQHDGPDDTVDEWGKPNGWCWSCWKSRKVAEAQTANDLLRLEVERLTKRCEEARPVIQEFVDECRCRCDKCWTDRQLHAPECKGYLVPDADKWLEGKP